MADKATRQRLDACADAIAALLGVRPDDVWIRDKAGAAEVVLGIGQAEMLIGLCRAPAATRALELIVHGATATQGNDSSGWAYAHVRQAMLNAGRHVLGLPVIDEGSGGL
jgi:hypothetical protein